MSSVSNGGGSYAASVANNNIAPLSLESSFKGASLHNKNPKEATNYALMDQSAHQSQLAQKSAHQNSKGVSQTTQGLLQNYTSDNNSNAVVTKQYVNNSTSMPQQLSDQQIDVAMAVGGEGLSPISGSVSKPGLSQQA